MELNVTGGPWHDLLIGSIEGFDYEVKISKDNTIISMIYEKSGKTIKAVLLEVFRVLHAKGDATSFLRHIPKRTIALNIHSQDGSSQFILIDSGIEYIPYDKNNIIQKVEEMIKRIESLTNILLKVSLAYDIKLTELKDCDEEIKSTFFSMPLVNLLVAPLTKKCHSPDILEVSHGEIHLGITKTGAMVKEPFDFFERTVVFGGQEKDRIHVLHILAESAIISGFPLIIIDWTDSFRGLNVANQNIAELTKYKVELDPVGFPTKVFTAGVDIKVQVEYIDPEVLIELFGIGKNIAGQVIIEAFKKGNFKTIEELKKKISEIEETPKITPFVKREAQRIIEVIECIYPDIFSNTTPVEEITKKWARGLSRANILLFKGDDFRKSILILQTTLVALKNHLKSQGASNKMRAILFFTAGNMTIPRFSATYTNKRLASDVSEMTKYGCGLILEANDKIDINPDVSKLFFTSIGIIAGNDAAVVIENRKNYRVFIRPGLSDCCSKISSKIF
ncbi:MAG: hypothetical protein QXM75_00650 [Candidatus Diapherotrites archaeon]